MGEALPTLFVWVRKAGRKAIEADRGVEESGQPGEALNQDVVWTGNALLSLLQRGLKHREARELVIHEWLFPPGEEENPPREEDTSA